VEGVSWASATLASPRVDLDVVVAVVVVVDLDGDGDVEVDATVDGPSIFVRRGACAAS
jgi:hypothetical protein